MRCFFQLCIIPQGSISFVNQAEEELNCYRLHKHIVFAKQQHRPAVLMQRFHVFTGRGGGGGALVHAAAGVTLLDLQKMQNTTNPVVIFG